jgi:O-antigen/teichoic acid export membrane protein
LVKFTAEARSENYETGAAVGWLAAWRTTALCAIGGLLLISGVMIAQPQLIKTYFHFFILAWILAVTSISKMSLEAAFRGLKSFYPPALWAIIIAPIQAIVVIAGAFAGYRIAFYLSVMAAGGALNAIALTIHYRYRHRDLNLSTPAAIERVRDAFRYARPLMARGVIWFFFLKVNILIVAYFHSDAETGYIAFADRFLLLPLLVIAAFVNAVAPRIAECTKRGDRESIQNYANNSYSALFLLMLPFVFIFVVVGPFIEHFLPNYAPAIILIRVMAPFLILKAWGGMAMSGLIIPGGYARQALIIGAVGAVANLLINFALVPVFASYGSVVGMIIVHTASAFAAIAVAHRLMKVEFRLALPGSRN